MAKLNTLGLAAYTSPEGAPGHDVIVVVDGQPRSIEVKTRQFLRRATEITRWPVEMDKKGDADFFIFIELDLRTMAPTFYVLTNEQARAVHRSYLGGGNCYPPEVRKMIQPNDFSALRSDVQMKPSEEIRKLAVEHGITGDPAFIDVWADKISELSGETGDTSDEIEQLLINMRRANKIDPAVARSLFHRYMTTEKYPGIR